jgi:hypothetical protein
MKIRLFLLTMLVGFLMSCGPSASELVPVSELPDPAIYALRPSELPDVGLGWQQAYNQTSTEQGYKWSYLAYQAYQPGSLGVELESGFAVNNDVVLYESDMSRETLPQPPSTLGEIQVSSWKSVSQPHRVGDKSAAWKTSLGDLLTPVWWLEFYQGHAYVRISLLGFPDQIASSILYGLADIVAERLPGNAAKLRSDAGTVIATPLPIEATSEPDMPSTPPPQGSATPAPGSVNQPGVTVLSYSAPPGETGMVSYFDDTLDQLSDGIYGADDILADEGKGTAYEWVGWTELTDPVTLTFTLQADVILSSIEIGFNHRDGLGVFVPDRVAINGMEFALQADAVPNNQRADLSFPGPFQGPVVNIVLHHRGRGWILVDEVRFLPGVNDNP